MRGTRAQLRLGAALATGLVLLSLPIVVWPQEKTLVDYRREGDAIVVPLSAGASDPRRGMTVAAGRELGNCGICHYLSLPGISPAAFGTLGPSLAGVGARLSAGQLRLRIVDASLLNPDTRMPAYYRVDGFTRVAPAFRDRPILNARQVEDLVAYLASLQATAP
ncbi:MAG: sulfur oxidation c-type cytochrome SoxX [Parahaliea sp.]